MTLPFLWLDVGVKADLALIREPLELTQVTPHQVPSRKTTASKEKINPSSVVLLGESRCFGALTTK